MLDTFLTQTCTITRKTTTNVDWIVKPLITTIYSNIKCYTYNYNWSLDNTEIAQNTSLETKKAIIQPNKVNVKQWDIIEIIDPFMLNFGQFQILLNPKPNYLIDWTLDSIELILKQIWK